MSANEDARRLHIVAENRIENRRTAAADKMSPEDEVTKWLHRMLQERETKGKISGWSVVSDPGSFPMLVRDDPMGQVHIEEAHGEIWGIDETFEDDNPVVRKKFDIRMPMRVAHGMLNVANEMPEVSLDDSDIQPESDEY